MTTQLPARPRLRGHEDLEAYLQRCATANGLTLTELIGSPSLTRLCENPPEAMVTRVAEKAGIRPERLRQATLVGAFPGARLDRARTGRRRSGQPATCPACTVSTVGARLHLTVLCPRCGTLLADDQDPTPLDPPTVLETIQADILETLSRAGSSGRARKRLTRLEALMRAQEPALWANWPPLLEGESAQWRAAAVRFAGFAITPGVVTPRPPFVTATLMALTWPFSADVADTRDRIDTFAIMSETWRPKEGDLPHWQTMDEAKRNLPALLRQSGLRFEHIPTTIRLPEDSIVLPPYLQTRRTAEAIALATLAQPGREANSIGLRETVAQQQHSVSDRTIRLATRMLTDGMELRYMAAHALQIHSHEPRDLRRLRGELRCVDSVPHGVTRQLPNSGVDPRNLGRVSAAWVWLDATQGRPAGGPHPHLSQQGLRDFDRALNPEGRMLLREWWQQRLQEVPDQSTTGEEQRHDRRAG